MSFDRQARVENRSGQERAFCTLLLERVVEAPAMTCYCHAARKAILRSLCVAIGRLLFIC